MVDSVENGDKQAAHSLESKKLENRDAHPYLVS